MTNIIANSKDFDSAVALVEDYLFKLDLDNTNQDDLKLLKLLKARENNPKFELNLAVIICGDGDSYFPYRSSYFLTEFFKNLGFRYEHDGSTRRFWVEEVLKQLNIKEIATLVTRGLFNKRNFKDYCKQNDLDFDSQFKNAVQEFRDFVDDSVQDNIELDLSYLLNMNINTDLLFNQLSQTKDPPLNDLIRESKDRFLNLNDKQIALEKLWDAFERVKTYYGTDKKKSATILISKIASELESEVLEDEFKKLTLIGNNYRIRHHEQGKIELKDKSQIDYLYFRVLSLIDLCIRKINEHGD